MDTTGKSTGRLAADGGVRMGTLEGLAMHVHVEAHMQRLLNQAATERLVSGSDESLRLGRRLRRRLGRAVVGLGRSIEGPGCEPGTAAA